MAKFLGFDVQFFEQVRVYSRSVFSQEQGLRPDQGPVFRQYQGKKFIVNLI